MRVQRVVMPDGAESSTVLGDTGEPVAPIEAFLAHLQALDRSPTTARAYATSLKLWFEFLALVDSGWDEAKAEHVSRFVAWLRAPADNVVVLEGGSARRAPATVNRHLAALFSFYDYQARNGVELAQARPGPSRRHRPPGRRGPRDRSPAGRADHLPGPGHLCWRLTLLALPPSRSPRRDRPAPPVTLHPRPSCSYSPTGHPRLPSPAGPHLPGRDRPAPSREPRPNADSRVC